MIVQPMKHKLEGSNQTDNRQLGGCRFEEKELSGWSDVG